MLSYYLEKINAKFDDLILKKEMPEKDKLIDYLDSIRIAREFEVNCKRLRNIFSLFSKWKLIFEIHYNECYHHRIRATGSSNIHENDEFPIVFEGFKQKIESALGVQQPNYLTNLLSPYCAITSNFYTNPDENLKVAPISENTDLTSYFKATDQLFKKSEFASAEQRYLKYINYHSSNNLNDIAHLSLLGWAFHGIGNIKLIVGRYDDALNYFEISYAVKKNVCSVDNSVKNEMSLLGTHFKLIWSELARFDRHCWNKKLLEFYSELNKNKIRNSQPEDIELWYKNILVDTELLLSKSFFYLNDNQQSIDLVLLALEKHNDLQDIPGKLNAYIQLGLVDTSNMFSILNEIYNMVSDLSNKNKSDPHIKKIITGANFSELLAADKMFAFEIKECFTSHKINEIEYAC